MAGRIGVPEDGNAGEIWRELLEQLEPLGALFGRDQGQPGHIASRSGQTYDVTCAQRVADGGHDDGDAAGRLARGLAGLGCVGDDHIDIGTDKFGREGSQAFRLVIGKAEFEGNVAPFAPAPFLQSFFQCSEPTLPFWIIFGEPSQYPDAPDPFALLRPRREWPRQRARDECDERAPVHSDHFALSVIPAEREAREPESSKHRPRCMTRTIANAVAT